MNVETKELNLNVLGKDGPTRAYKIQKHKPTAPMCYIRTVTGHMLFCQEDHPIWVQREDGEVTVIQAKEILNFKDKLWVDTSSTKLPLNEDLNSIKNSYIDHFYEVLDDILVNKNSKAVLDNPQYFKGSSNIDFLLNLEFLNFTKVEYIDLFYRLKEKHIFSFNFVSQLKLIGDFLREPSIMFMFDNNNCSWILYKFDFWNRPVTLPEGEYIYVETHSTGIDSYEGYVYDLKTESEEFLNNSVQTHNSFHCFHKDSEVYYIEDKYSGLPYLLYKSKTMETIWNELPEVDIKEVPYSNNMIQYEKDVSQLNIFVEDRQTNNTRIPAKVLKVIRHKQDPTTKMISLIYTSTSGEKISVISQDNHRHFKLDAFGAPILTEAKDMKVGDFVARADGKSVQIESIEQVPDIPEDEYVYDLTTETGTLFVNGMYTHNTGGAVVFKKVDILKELSDSITKEEEKYLAEMLYQKDNDLYSHTEVTTIKINKNIFKDDYSIEKVGNTYKLPLGYFKMYVGNIEVKATVEMPVEINIHEDYNETDDTITLMYGKDVKLFTIKFFKIAPEKIAQSLDSLVAGKSPWETPEDLYKKFYEALSSFAPWDSCHLEVILATILRNKKDPMVAARLKEPYAPELHSIKSLPSQISWSLGIAYENLGKALSYGLISKDTTKPSQIEKVLFGEPLSNLSIEKLKEKKK